MNKCILTACMTLPLVFGSVAFATETKQMDCEDGQSFKIAYPASDLVMINYSEELILLRLAVSASGARYVGEGWQWWNKGEAGYLAPLAKNEDYASAKGVSCSTPANAALSSRNTVGEPVTPENAVMTNETVKPLDYEQEREPKPFTYE